MNLSDALANSPVLFPLNIDAAGTTVQFIQLLEPQYEQVSFLDGRDFGTDIRSALIPWSELEPAASGLPLRCNFIFHISHAGSTLLARLLGQHPNCFSIREPAILRLLGQGMFADRWDIFLGLWSRTFRAEQTACIKATSFVSEISASLLDRVPNAKAVLMYIPARTFLAALLDGAMTDIDSNVASRLARLQKRGFALNVPIESLSPGPRVAMSWLAEMVSLNEAATKFPGRTLWFDFDQFLRAPEPMLVQVFDHLGCGRPELAQQILAGPNMSRYAKRPEVQYDKTFRAKLLQNAEANFGNEISLGMDWLEQNVGPELRSYLEDSDASAPR